MKQKRKQFTRALEDRAKDVVANMRGALESTSITSLLEQEITLTLENLNSMRKLHNKQLKSLRRAECYTDTELMQMEAREPKYSSYRFPEREKFQQRLFAIEAERRKHRVFYEERMQGLQKNLLSLVQKHRQVNVGHGLRERRKGPARPLRTGSHQLDS